MAVVGNGVCPSHWRTCKWVCTPKDERTKPFRSTSAIRAEVEAVLREGESLTQFIEEAVVAAAARRRVQTEFVARGEAAIERWKKAGGGHGVDEVMADLQGRLNDARTRAARRRGK